jgi:hypothetical protein
MDLWEQDGLFFEKAYILTRKGIPSLYRQMVWGEMAKIKKLFLKVELLVKEEGGVVEYRKRKSMEREGCREREEELKIQKKGEEKEGSAEGPGPEKIYEDGDEQFLDKVNELIL